MSSTAATPAAPARPVLRTPLWPIAAAAGAVGLLAAATLASHGTEVAGLERLNRYLARLGFLVFLPIYTASPLAKLVPSPATRWLVRMRRSLGLSYALVMGAHLCTILAWFATPEIVVEPNLTLIGGGAGMVLIAVLAATPNDASVRRLGRRTWRGVHGAALHFLWVIYLVTYLGRITESQPEFWPGLAVVIALAGLRFAARGKRRAA